MVTLPNDPATKGPDQLLFWPYLTRKELSHCFGPGELEEVKDFAHRTGRDYLTALRLLFGEKRVWALRSVLDAALADDRRDGKGHELLAELRQRYG